MVTKAKSKIGKFLIEKDFISSEQVEQILELQKLNPDMKFGEIALQLGHFDRSAINQYIIYIQSDE